MTRAVEWFCTAERLAASPGIVRQLVELEAAVDIRAVLPVIRVPTIVMHRREDPMVDFELGRQFAAAIPGARFIPLEGGDNFAIFGDSDAILDEVEEFLTGARRHHEFNRVLTTVLFTDIVDSTRQAAELGDRERHDVLGDHYRRIRREVERFQGREVRTLGDGFLATFDGPARAIRCGCEIASDGDVLGVATRVGVHTGEVELLEGDLAGIAVHIGARVAAEADPGEVFVSGTVKDLVVGSGITFADRGERRLKGVPGGGGLSGAVERDGPGRPERVLRRPRAGIRRGPAGGRRRAAVRARVALFHERQAPDRVVVLLTGTVKLSSISEDGKEVLLALRGPGDLLGELGALDGHPRSATAIALVRRGGAGRARGRLHRVPRAAPEARC